VASATATDLKISWDTNLLFGDLIQDADYELETDQGLATAVLMSLFTDRRARKDDLLPDPEGNDRRGWWGDKTGEYREAGDQIGSRLWLLERSKTTSETITQAESYATEALQWLIDDGIAVKVDVTAVRQMGSRGTGGDPWLVLDVLIRKTDGSQASYKFDLQWGATLA